MARVTHFEIPTADPERAMQFYRRAFGWQFQEFGEGMGYWLCDTGGADQPGINGGLMKRRGEGQPVTCTVAVESVDQALSDVAAAGGELVVPKMEIPGVGFIAYFKDTEGNIFGLHEEMRR